MDRKKGRLNFHRVINDRSGFTLAELLLVVGIIVILTGVSVLAGSYYFRVLKLNELDNTAKQIFIAAQNHLTSAQSTGELDRYVKSDEVANNKPNGSVDPNRGLDDKALGVLMDYKPSDADNTSVNWPNPLDSNKEFYYILHDEDSDGTDEGINNSVLKYALPKNAIDDYVNAEGKYIIEYDIETASVYSVFYTEKKNELSYATIANELNGNGDLSGRGGSSEAKNVRKNHMHEGKNQIIGYYGGAMAEQWMAQNHQLEISVKNGADQDTKGWDNATDNIGYKSEYNDEQLIAIIRDYGNTNTDKIMLQVHGKTSGNDALVSLNTNTAGISEREGTKTYMIDCGLGGAISDRNTFGSVNIINENSSDECREYQIVLDDLVVESGVGTIHNCHFAYLFPTLIPGEDIELTAYSYQNGSIAGQSDQALTTNSLFGATDTISTTGAITKKSAEISSFRHLENMDIENMSALMTFGSQYNYGEKFELQGGEIVEKQGAMGTTGTSGTIDYVFTNFKQTADLDWQPDGAANPYYTDKTLCGVNKVSISGEYSVQTNPIILYLSENENKNNGGNIVHPGTFKSIKSKDMLEYDGNNKKISNVKIHTNSVVPTDSSNSRSNGGLFAYLEQTSSMQANCSIHDLSLIGFDVTAPKNASALVSESAINQSYELQIDKVLVAKGNIVSQYKYINTNTTYDGSNRGNVGALVGYCGSKAIVNKCASSATIEVTGNGHYEIAGNHYSAADAGGLIGEGRNVIKITDSYTGGTTNHGGEYSTNASKYNIIGTYTAGGLLGRATTNCNTTFKNCYSTCSVYGSFNNNSVPAKSGGLIGLQEKGKLQIDNSYSTGKISGKWSDSNKTIKGTILGFAYGANIAFKDSYYLRGDNEYGDNETDYLKAVGIDVSTEFSSADDSGVEAHNYNQMMSGRSKETHPNNREGKYPFRVVNKTGIVDSSKTGVHYGDWPKTKKYIADNVYEDLLFAYKEVMDSDGDGTPESYWYVESKNNAGNYNVELNSLPTDKNVYLNDASSEGKTTWTYGFLCPKKYTQVDGSGNITEKDTTFPNDYFFGSVAFENTNEIVTVNGEEYSFCEYTPANGNSADIVTTPTQIKGNTASVFMFNTKFAAAISTSEKNDLGSATNKYQVRTVKQLESVKMSSATSANDYVDGKNYAQTLDIDLDLASTAENNPYKFSPIGTRATPFTGTYTGIVSKQETETGKDNSHTIKNFYQEVTGTNSLAGLFGRVTGTASQSSTITNVNIVGRTVNDSNTENDIVVYKGSENNSGPMHIGGLVSLTDGENVNITDCSANLAIATSNENNNTFELPNDLVFIGGMFGNLSAKKTNSKVSGCSFDGKVTLDVGSIAGVDTRIRAGGFAGGSTCDINKNDENGNAFTVGSDSHPVELTISLPSGSYTMGSTRNDRIGGVVGEFQGGLFANCTSNANTNYDTAKSRYAYIGSVLGYWKGVKMSICNHTGNIKVNNNSTTVTLFDGSQIGRIFGINDYSATVINLITFNDGVIKYKGIDITGQCGDLPDFTPYPDFTP